MNLKLKHILGCIVFLMAFQFNNSLFAQSNDEIWPELDGIYTFRRKFRLVTNLSFTRRESEYSDGNFALLLDYFTLPFLRKVKGNQDTTMGYYQWLRVGYSYGHSISKTEDEFTQNMFRIESNTRFHLPYHFLATVKNRFDLRIYNHAAKERYRPRLTLERDFKTTYMTFTMYGYAEYYFNLNKNMDNRARLCLGAEIWVSKLISTEFYYLKQYEINPDTPNTNAVGLILKFNMKSKARQHAIDTKKEEEIREN